MLDQLVQIAEGFPGVTMDMKWEHHLCFNVGGKMFFISSPDEHPVNASFKVKADDFDQWLGKAGCISAPYLGRYKWIQLDDISRLPIEEWNEVLATAYEEIYSKLPAKVRKEIGRP